MEFEVEGGDEVEMEWVGKGGGSPDIGNFGDKRVVVFVVELLVLGWRGFVVEGCRWRGNGRVCCWR